MMHHSALIGTIVMFPLFLHAEERLVVDAQEFETLLTYTHTPIFVTFTAPWCSICTSLKGPMAELRQDALLKNVTFVTVDFDKQKTLCQKYKVDRIPTFCYFLEGKKIKQEVGVKRGVEIKKFFQKELTEIFNLNNNNIQQRQNEFESFSLKSILSAVAKPPLKALKNGIDWCLERL